MKKLIEIEFPDDFTPPPWSYSMGDNCGACPFQGVDDGICYCVLIENDKGGDGSCPIKKYWGVI